MNRKNILEALFRGEISPWDKRFDHSPEYEECAKILFGSEERLTERLDEEGRALLDQFTSAEDDLSDFDTLEYFIEGFRLGSAFMRDTFMAS